MWLSAVSIYWLISGDRSLVEKCNDRTDVRKEWKESNKELEPEEREGIGYKERKIMEKKKKKKSERKLKKKHKNERWTNTTNHDLNKWKIIFF